MRIRHLILPSILVVAACAKTSSKLHVDHNLSVRGVKADEATMTKLVGDGKCLNLNTLVAALRSQGQVSMTAYVRNLELRDEASTDEKPLTVDPKTAATQLLQTLNPPVLIENFTGNTLSKSKLLAPYILNMVQNEDCTTAGPSNDPTEFTVQGAKEAITVTPVKSNAKVLATPVPKRMHSITRDRLDLQEDGRLLSYHETGSSLVITIDETLPQTLKTCDNPTATLSRHMEIVLEHSGNFEIANVARPFAALLNASIDSKSLPKKIADSAKAPAQATTNKITDVRAQSPLHLGGYIELNESEMGTLQTAILSGLIKLPECKTKADGQSK